MSKRFIRKMKKAIPELSDDIADNIRGNITELATDAILTEQEHEKQTRGKRLYSISDVDNLKSFIKFEELKHIDKKFQIPVSFVVYDVITGGFRIRAYLNVLGISKPVYISLGESINIDHVTDSTFNISFIENNKPAEIVYDSATKEILKYKI